MSNIYRIELLFVFALLIVACGAPTSAATPTVHPPSSATPESLPPARIVRHPMAADFSRFNGFTPPRVMIPNQRSSGRWTCGPPI